MFYIYLRRKEIFFIFFRQFVELPAKNQPLLDYFWDISRDWERLQRRQLCMGTCILIFNLLREVITALSLDQTPCSDYLPYQYKYSRDETLSLWGGWVWTTEVSSQIQAELTCSFRHKVNKVCYNANIDALMKHGTEECRNIRKSMLLQWIRH